MPSTINHLDDIAESWDDDEVDNAVENGLKEIQLRLQQQRELLETTATSFASNASTTVVSRGTPDSKGKGSTKYHGRSNNKMSSCNRNGGHHRTNKKLTTTERIEQQVNEIRCKMERDDMVERIANAKFGGCSGVEYDHDDDDDRY